jgi:hypothetical protein
MITFERITNANVIPAPYVRQVRENDFDVKRFYTFMNLALQSPTQFLYAVLSEEHFTVGYLWLEVNLLDEELFVNTYSVDKGFCAVYDVMAPCVSHIKKIANELQLKRVVWQTRCPRTFEALGFTRGKEQIMYYEVHHGR